MSNKIFQVFVGDTPYEISEGSVEVLKKRIETTRVFGHGRVEFTENDFPKDGKYGVLVFPGHDTNLLAELRNSPLNILDIHSETGPIEVKMTQEIAAQIDAIVLD